MKLLHTGDWHLGKRVHGVSFIEDQAYALKGLLEQIIKEKPDVILIAGDIYDRSVPPVEAITLADDFFRQLRAAWHCQVVMISGNHDSPERLGFGRGFLALSDVLICTTYEDAITPLSLRAKDGTVQCFAMPFLEPVVVKAIWEAKGNEWQWPLTQQGLFEHMLTQWEPQFDQTTRRILLAHAFVGSALPSIDGDGIILSAEGLEQSESERPLSIGGQDIVDVQLFDAFDYVALGHLHRPQGVGRDTVRYAGSLLKYSFSEAMQVKGMTWLELSNTEVNFHQTQLPLLRDLRIVEGSLEHVTQVDAGQTSLKMKALEDYVMVILTDQGALYEPMRRLRSVYPNCLKMERSDVLSLMAGLRMRGYGAQLQGNDGQRNDGQGNEGQGNEGQGNDGREGAFANEGPRFEQLSPLQVFEQFYRSVVGIEPGEDQLKTYQNAVLEALKEGDL